MTKSYDYADDYSDDVLNVSGARWPDAEMQARPRTITSPRPGQHVSHRTPVEIDAESGARLDAELAKGLTLAAERRLSVRRTVEAATSDSQRAYEDHVFGLNLPGRDRA